MDHRVAACSYLNCSLWFSVVCLKTDLQHPVSQGVSVERLNGDQTLVVVRHGDESEAFALVGLQVTDHFDILDSSERPEQLPQDVLLRLRRQVVDEQTPTAAVHRRGRTRARKNRVAS